MIVINNFIYLIFLLLSVSLGKKPHIFLIAIDDLGYSDHTLYVGKNGTDIEMPNLQKMSDSGIRLDAYYTQLVCSPTRSSLMTGLFPFRTGMQHSTTLVPGTTAALPLEIPTLPEKLKSLGYKTHMIGKWHLGYASWANTPHGRGFDEFRGYLQGQQDYFNKTIGINDKISGYDFWHNFKRDNSATGSYSLNQYMTYFENMLDSYINIFPDETKQEKNPFFVYFSHQSVHVPIQPANGIKGEKKCTQKNKWRRLYCSMLVELDFALGKTISLIKKHNMWNNSLILLTTDNGGMTLWGKQKNGDPAWPASVGTNYPLRGGKATLFEGGVRGTALITGGDFYIPKELRGSSYDGLMHAVDFHSIIIGSATSQDSRKFKNYIMRPVDGIDLMPHITQKIKFLNHSNTKFRKHIPININYKGKKITAIRFGKYKLIVGLASPLGDQADGWFPIDVDLPKEMPNQVALNGKCLLFDVVNDPTERINLSDHFPEYVSYGLNLITKYMNTGYVKPQTNLMHIKSLPFFHNHSWAPFLTKQEARSKNSFLSAQYFNDIKPTLSEMYYPADKSDRDILLADM